MIIQYHRVSRDAKSKIQCFILREFVMSKVSTDSMMNVDMVVDLLRPQLEVTKEDIEPVIIIGLYHHRNLIGSRDAFMIR